MELLSWTCASVAEDLALDEALLEESEQSEGRREWLRIWEPPQFAVVVGRGSRARDEVRLAACQQRGIPVLRRASGGAAVVIGPGCLVYSLILSIAHRPQLGTVDGAHRLVLERLVGALAQIDPRVHRVGISDLAIDDRKFSGNSLRCKRSSLLYHGTILYDFPLSLIHECLEMPPRQPAYRANRDHGAFLTNLPAPCQQLRQALVRCWNAREGPRHVPWSRAEQLYRERYARADWHLGR